MQEGGLGRAVGVSWEIMDSWPKLDWPGSSSRSRATSFKKHLKYPLCLSPHQSRSVIDFFPSPPPHIHSSNFCHYLLTPGFFQSLPVGPFSQAFSSLSSPGPHPPAGEWVFWNAKQTMPASHLLTSLAFQPFRIKSKLLNKACKATHIITSLPALSATSCPHCPGPLVGHSPL